MAHAHTPRILSMQFIFWRRFRVSLSRLRFTRQSPSSLREEGVGQEGRPFLPLMAFASELDCGPDLD